MDVDVEGGLNDSGIALENPKCKGHVAVELENLKSNEDSGKSSMSSSRGDEITEVKSTNSSDSTNTVDASRDLLLNPESTKTESKWDEEDQKHPNCFLHGITVTIGTVKSSIYARRELIYQALGYLFWTWNSVWLIIAAVMDFQRCLPFLVIYCLIVVYKAYCVLKDRFGKRTESLCSWCMDVSNLPTKYMKWIALVLGLVGMGFWIAFDTINRPHQLISLCGYFVFLFLLFLASNSPKSVKWRPVLWGCAIQVILGVFILRTTAGYTMFDFLGSLVRTFLSYVQSGCKFVFGEAYEAHYFAFAVLPIIIYFSAFISILYHLGAMQWIISKIAWLMQISLGTSATESMVAAGNIFVGQTESPLLIRPYIKDLTTSELHAVMTAGFGTIAGSVLGAYLGFGVKPVYVITACVMAAPCALAVSKLLYPETKQSKFTSDEGLVLESSGHRNIIEAAFVGASQAIPLVLNIAANLIAFIAMLAAINGFLGWYGRLVDIENLSFEFLCSFIFWPFSYLMGIEWVDCFKCAELIGKKVFLNEFIAYEELSVLIDNKKPGNISRINETTGEVMWISDRSEAIITYALCGFANVGSLGIMLGGLGAMCPERQGEMASIVIRALTGGVFVSFLNACIAGFFYHPPEIDCGKILSNPWGASETGYLYQCCSDLDIGDVNTFDSCCNYTWPPSYSSITGC